MERMHYKIDIQERSYKFALSTIKFIRSSKLNDIGSRTMINQLTRSSTSIGANIVEAQAGSSRKDFRIFILHALKSANETTYWLRLLKDSNDLNGNIDSLIKEAEELTKILGKSAHKLK